VAERRKRLTVDGWKAVRAAYEVPGETIAAIAKRFGTSTRAIHKHALDEGWSRRYEGRQVDRSGIITRMFRVLQRQIVFMEENMTQAGEKEVAVLGKLASTLEKLIQIDDAAAEKPKPANTKEMTNLRNRLAERIEQLKRA